MKNQSTHDTQCDKNSFDIFRIVARDGEVVVRQGNIIFLLSERGFQCPDNPDVSEKACQLANEAQGHLNASQETIHHIERVSQPAGGQSELKDPTQRQLQRTGHEGDPCVDQNYPWLGHLSNLSVDTLFNVCLEVYGKPQYN